MTTLPAAIVELRRALATTIVGQERLLDRLVVGLLVGGHVLVGAAGVRSQYG